MRDAEPVNREELILRFAKQLNVPGGMLVGCHRLFRFIARTAESEHAETQNGHGSRLSTFVHSLRKKIAAWSKREASSCVAKLASTASSKWQAATKEDRKTTIQFVVDEIAQLQSVRRIGRLTPDGEGFLAQRITEIEATGDAFRNWTTLGDWPVLSDPEINTCCRNSAHALKAVLRSLFEFRTGPIVPPSLAAQPGGVLTLKIPATPGGTTPGKFRDNFVSGLEPDQAVFLNRPGVNGGSVCSLDHFAVDVAEGNLQDGIYAVAGPRGSGKSTILNRIQAMCKHYARAEGPRGLPRAGRSWRPLLVRFDLGVGFDEKRFPLEFMAQTCNAVKLHCTTKPSTHAWSPNWVRHALGEVGRWCETNWLWALLMTIALVAAGAASLISSEIKQSFETILTAKAVCLTGNFLLSVCAVSFIYRFFGKRSHGLRRDFSPWFMAILFLVATYCVAAGRPLNAVPDFANIFVFLGNSLPGEATFQPLALTTMSRFMLAHWLLTVAVCAAMFLLPGWWWTYAYCQSLGGALRAKAETGGGMDIPYLSGFSKLIGTLLPKLPDGGDVRDMDTPFAVEKLKDLLRRCVADFERVVILIDDVDVTPDKQYPQLMQLLRPLNKIPGVCCIIAAPTEFYENYRDFPANDYHSTLQDCLLVGDRRYAVSSENIGRCNKRDLHKTLEPLLKPIFNSHCVLQRESPRPGEEHPLDRLLAALWLEAPPSDRLWDAARQREIARRDLVRAAAALLET